MKSKIQAKDLRGIETAELEGTLKKLREELFQHHLKHNTNQIENTMTIRSTRRDIAKVCTVLAEKSRKAATADAKEK
jgi:large subunit ribosomal protein L29